jgi:hypothetical protein
MESTYLFLTGRAKGLKYQFRRVTELPYPFPTAKAKELTFRFPWAMVLPYPFPLGSGHRQIRRLRG